MFRARAVTLSHYHEVARFVGLNPYVMLARSGLKSTMLKDPEGWLPAKRVLEVIDASAVKSRRDDFAILLGRCRTFASLGPVSLLLKHEATVRGIILAIVEYRHLLNDLLHMTVRDDGRSAMIEWSLLPGLHSAQGINLLATVAYKGLSGALESDWQPECIHFRHSAPRNLESFRRYFGCPLEFDSHFDGMSCASAALDRPNRSADADLAAHVRGLLNLLPRVRQESVCDKARSVILLLIADGKATAKNVAQCLGVPVRTLQRRLIQEGSSFTDILTDTRKELVVRYLMSSSQPLTTVSQLVGYSTLSSFTRWFAGEFGAPPLKWRKLRRHEVEGSADHSLFDH
jgi:AraC-like DNA-binding protein